MTTDVQWPGDGETLERWVRATLEPDDDVVVEGLDDVRVTARVDGDDVDILSIDASDAHVTVQFVGGELSDTAPRATAPLARTVVQRRTGVARALRIIARPVHVQGFPIHIDAQLSDVPLEWLVYDLPSVAHRPETAREIEIDGDGADMRGSVTASIGADDIAPLLTSLLRPGLATTGVHLRRLRARVEADGTDGIRVMASAAIRWKVFGASAYGEARIDVAPDGVFTVRDLSVGSRNPVVSLGLRAARKSIRTQIGQSADINASLADEGVRVRVHDVRITADRDIVFSARLS